MSRKSSDTYDSSDESPTRLTSPEPSARLKPAEPSARPTSPEPSALTQDLRGDRFAVDSAPDAPPEGERWSSWDGAQHGPGPRPGWVITDLGAVDQDLGILKSGKEADVHVVRRWVPRKNKNGQDADSRRTDKFHNDNSHTDSRHIESSHADNSHADNSHADSRHADDDNAVYMAAKRFRDSEHRMFHRDAGYLEGRRVRRSREMRAMERRTEFGRQLISGQWAYAEFNALGELWALGLPVPYPVQLDGTEVLMEFIGDQGVSGSAAPRLAQTRPEPAQLADLFEQFRATVTRLAERGWAHGDLSPYNTLLHHDRLVIIDWPQIVDIIGNPQGPEFLHRDCHNMCAWFTSRGLAVDEEELFGDFMAAAVSRW